MYDNNMAEFYTITAFKQSEKYAKIQARFYILALNYRHPNNFMTTTAAYDFGLSGQFFQVRTVAKLRTFGNFWSTIF